MKKYLLSMMMLAFAGGLFAVGDVIDPGPEVSPVPEPASMIIMGAGLAGVAFLGWKRNKKK